MWISMVGLALAQDAVLDAFEGYYSGSAEVVRSDGTSANRDMSVEIAKTKSGFSVAWSTTSVRADGSINEKDYLIEFVPSERDGVYSAAMERNVFGHEVQLDPMKGEPFVWARIKDATLTVFSLFVDEAGDYELQQFDRTLVEGGLQLAFRVVRNGEVTRSVDTFLTKG
nr:hypothetical protein [Aestuariivita boseongensis]